MAKGGVTYVAGSVGGGATPDASLMKYTDGVPAWPAPKTYDSPYHGEDRAYKMALGPGDSIYTVGLSTGANGLLDILLLKWSSSGAVQWARRYDGPGHALDEAKEVVVDSVGNVTVAGVTMNGADMDWVLVSWSAKGVKRWTSRYSASEPHQMMPTGLVVAADRSVYATGACIYASGWQSLTARYSPKGKTLWKKAYTGPAGLGSLSFAAVPRPGGGVYVCGMARSAATDVDGLVMGYTQKGVRDVFALDTGPGGASVQSFRDLAVTFTKQVVAVGSHISAGNQDCRVVSYTKDGTIAGQVTLPGARNDEFVAVATDAFGGFYATGTYHTAINKTAVLTTRGSVLTGGGGFLSLWAPGFVSQENLPNAIAVRGSTAVVVGRCVEGPATGTDQFVLGYVY